ncbi:hypothetical protein ACS0TY_021459 [Phlomoides rotata]
MANGIKDHEIPYPTVNTYDVGFFGESIYTVVTCDPNNVTHWISKIMEEKCLPNQIVGLDIEWRPSSRSNVNHPAATIQLCVDSSCLIFQFLHSPPYPRQASQVPQ